MNNPLLIFPGNLIYKASSDWFFTMGSWSYESAQARLRYSIQKEKNRGSWR